ncbi:MAG: zinc ribbon domain-containing protein [Methanobacterium sp.]|nr:zinc ribbon domain-containing protein [Methanobacterium sp.]
MICDNCGAIIDKNEEFCPNCGMQISNLHPDPKKRKKYYKNSRSLSRNYSRSVDKPIKQRYIKNSKPESQDYSQYFDDEEYEPSNHDYYETNYKRKSGIGIGNIILLLAVALILGFITGLLMLGTLSIPPLP